MQIVINLPDTDITEDIIRAAKWENGSLFDMVLRGALKNATILPKGHGDLKDQKDLAKSLYDYQWIDQLTYMEVTNRLINTPTIIAEDKEQEDE